MSRILKVSAIIAMSAALTACSSETAESEFFTGPLTPTDAIAQPVKNLCPMEARKRCISDYFSVAAKMPSRTGKIVGDTIVLTPDQETGFALSGPRYTLHRGRFEFVLDYQRDGDDSGDPKFLDTYDIVEIIEVNGKKTVSKITEGLVPAGSEPLRVIWNFEASANQVQFRLKYGGQSTLTAKSVTVTALDKMILPAPR